MGREGLYSDQEGGTVMSGFVLTGVMGQKSWPSARPTRALPRAITAKQDKAARRLESKGGAAYLKTWGSRPTIKQYEGRAA